MSTAATPTQETAVLHVGGLHYASEKAVVERALGNRPGVLGVDANPVAQTATVRFDPSQTSVEALRTWVEECGYHCAGQSVPGHVCDPLAEAHEHPSDQAAVERAAEAHGHGHGGHAGMSMEAMVRSATSSAVRSELVTSSMLSRRRTARRPPTEGHAPPREGVAVAPTLRLAPAVLDGPLAGRRRAAPTGGTAASATRGSAEPADAPQRHDGAVAARLATVCVASRAALRSAVHEPVADAAPVHHVADGARLLELAA